MRKRRADRRRRGPTATERRLKAIHESDKSLTILLGPIVGGFANVVVVLWCVGMICTLFVGRAAVEGQVLLLIGAIPVLLFWILARGFRRMGEAHRRERENRSLIIATR